MRKTPKSAALAWWLMLALTAVAWAAPKGAAYPTPEAAVLAFSEALRRDDRGALLAVIGPDLPKLEPADAAERKVATTRLNVLFAEGWSLSTNQGGDRVLRLGAEGWSFPVPLTKTSRGWQFDTDAGLEEIANRQVGRNELAVIETCRLLVESETLFHQANSRYTDKTVSTPGQKDGLFWPVSDGEDLSPLAATFGDVATYATSRTKGTPWFGYYFHLQLTPQGYLLCAWPESYGTTGVMAFCCDQTGQLFEQDMGPSGGAAMRALEGISEGDGWTLVKE